MNQACTSYCGINCEKCTYREPMNCQGCISSKGTIFWGSCEVAACCISKGHAHCGKCDSFPCALLTSFAYDPEQGDNGKRIRNLEYLNTND